ncbi:hypothetical protein BDP27DRAFT_1404396, partial [Rhodocollybia butyracea]
MRFYRPVALELALRELNADTHKPLRILDAEGLRVMVAGKNEVQCPKNGSSSWFPLGKVGATGGILFFWIRHNCITWRVYLYWVPVVKWVLLNAVKPSRGKQGTYWAPGSNELINRRFHGSKLGLEVEIFMLEQIGAGVITVINPEQTLGVLTSDTRGIVRKPLNVGEETFHAFTAITLVARKISFTLNVEPLSDVLTFTSHPTRTPPTSGLPESSALAGSSLHRPARSLFENMSFIMLSFWAQHTLLLTPNLSWHILLDFFAFQHLVTRRHRGKQSSISSSVNLGRSSVNHFCSILTLLLLALPSTRLSNCLGSAFVKTDTLEEAVSLARRMDNLPTIVSI